MKTHSKEWFITQIAEAKREISTWPASMREARVVAAAAFPKIDNKIIESRSENTAKGNAGKQK
jgi:hypothetical protein